MAPFIALALVWATGGCALRSHDNIGELIASATAQGGAAPQGDPAPRAPDWSVPVAINLPPAPAGFAAGPSDLADYADPTAGPAEIPPAVGTPPAWNPTQPSPPYRLPPEFSRAEPAATVAAIPAPRPIPAAVAQLPAPAPAARTARAEPRTASRPAMAAQPIVLAAKDPVISAAAKAPAPAPVIIAQAPPAARPTAAASAATLLTPDAAETRATPPTLASVKPATPRPTDAAGPSLATASPAALPTVAAAPRAKAVPDRPVKTAKRATRSHHKVATTKAKTTRRTAKAQRRGHPTVTAKAKVRHAKPPTVAARNKRNDRTLAKRHSPRERTEADASPAVRAHPGHHPVPAATSAPSTGGFIGPMAPDSTAPIGVTHSSSLERRGPPPPTRLALSSPTLRIVLPGATHRTRHQTAAHARHGVDEMRIAFVLSHNSASEDHAL